MKNLSKINGSNTPPIPPPTLSSVSTDRNIENLRNTILPPKTRVVNTIDNKINESGTVTTLPTRHQPPCHQFNHPHYNYHHDATRDEIKNLIQLTFRKEGYARAYAQRRRHYQFLYNGVSSTKVFIKYLITAKTIFGVFLTVGSTVWVYLAMDGNDTILGNMEWILLTFALILPISASIRFAFNRREAALNHIAAFKSNAFLIYTAHAHWGENRTTSSARDDATSRKETDANNDHDGGNTHHPSSETTSTTTAPRRQHHHLHHSDKTLTQLILIGDELCRFLTLPTSSLSRHRILRAGRREASVTMEASYLLFDSLLATRVSRLTVLVEDLRVSRGMAATEASRIRQWERYLCLAMEELRMLKLYRTPQALRAFADIFGIILPPFYAPSFAQLAHNVQSLTVGIAFGVLASVCLLALSETVNVLEDPFVANLTLDGIDVHEELSVLHWRQLLNARTAAFPHSKPFQLPRDEEFRVLGEEENAALMTMGRMGGGGIGSGDCGGGVVVDLEIAANDKDSVVDSAMLDVMSQSGGMTSRISAYHQDL